MLQKLNERIQGVVAWVIVTLVAVTFALFGIDYYMQSRNTSLAAVEVNGTKITQQEYEINYRRVRQMQPPSQITVDSENQLKKQVLDDLIINELSVQAARNSGFEVTPAQAKSAILSIPQFQEDGQFSVNRYEQAITAALYTPESFLKQVRQGMLLNQQRFAFIGTSFALPSEVERFVKLYMQSRDYDYLLIPTSKFVNKNNVTDAEVKKYYQSHPKEFLDPEKVSLSYIELSMKAIRDSIKITDEQAKQYYDANQSNFLSPAQWDVAHILISVPATATEAEKQKAKDKASDTHTKLQAQPQRFAEFVKSLSDDKISTKKNGVLPKITAGQSDLDKHLVSLTKPGQISEPISTEHGFEIFKLESYKAATIKPFKTVEAEIKEQLAMDEVQTKYAQILEKLTELSYQYPDSLKQAAQATGLEIKHTKPFSKQGGNTPLTQNTQVINTAFSHDVLELSNNSEPVQVDSNKIVVLRVNERIKAKEKPLSEVKSAIISKIAESKALEKANALGQKLLTAAKDPSAITKLLNANNLHWENVQLATRDTNKVPAQINELAFSMTASGTTVGKIINKTQFSIVKLKNIQDGKMSQLDEERLNSIKQQLAANYGIMDYDLYVQGMLAKADIKKQ